MNRILKLGLLSVIVGALYSCSSDSLYDPDKAGDVKLAQYEAAFVGSMEQLLLIRIGDLEGQQHVVPILIAINGRTSWKFPQVMILLLRK